MAEVATKKKRVTEDDVPVISTVNPRDVLNSVLRILGKPHDLMRTCPSYTRATPVTQNSFRVNIYTESALPGIADTFFVHVDGNGTIVSATPEIIKRYE